MKSFGSKVDSGIWSSLESFRLCRPQALRFYSPENVGTEMFICLPTSALIWPEGGRSRYVALSPVIRPERPAADGRTGQLLLTAFHRIYIGATRTTLLQVVAHQATSPGRSQGLSPHRAFASYAKRLRATPATPSIPVPSRAIVEGSGVVAIGARLPTSRSSL